MWDLKEKKFKKKFKEKNKSKVWTKFKMEKNPQCHKQKESYKKGKMQFYVIVRKYTFSFVH